MHHNLRNKTQQYRWSLSFLLPWIYFIFNPVVIIRKCTKKRPFYFPPWHTDILYVPTSLAIGQSVWQNSGQKNVNEMELDHFQIWPIILSNPPSSPLSWLHGEGSEVPRVGPGATRNITGSLNDCMEQFFTINFIELLHEWRADLFWVSLLSWINQSFPCSPLDFYHVKRSPQSVHNLHVFQLKVRVPNYMCSLASWFFPSPWIVRPIHANRCSLNYFQCCRILHCMNIA